jgi:TonB-dependent SusC/RagA subfamily outer membrane receptor
LPSDEMMDDTPTMRTARALVIMSVAATTACAPANRPTSGAANPRAASSTSDASLAVDQSRHAYTSMEELIEARAPGVQVIRQNGSFVLRIRGLSSPVGKLDPLIVIDGHPSDLPGTRALEALSPNDVVRIEVLKDAASTAFYGARGGSGVILIKTRT